MRFIFFLFLINFLSLNLFSLEEISLEELINSTILNNIKLLKSEQRIIIARQKVREARLIFLPQVTFSADLAKPSLEYPISWGIDSRYLDLNYDNEYFYALSVNVNLPVYTGGRFRKMLDSSKTIYIKETADYEIIKRKITIEVKKKYYWYLYLKQIYLQANKNYEESQKYLKEIKNKNLYYYEMTQIAEEIKNDLNKTKQDLELSFLDLKKMSGKNYDFSLIGEIKPFKEENLDFSKILIKNIENRPELTKEIYQSKLDALSVEIANTRKYPNIYLGFSYENISNTLSSLYNPDESKNNNLIYLNIRFPLPYDIWTQIRQKKAESRVNELEMISIEEDIKTEIENSYKNFIFYSKNIKEKEKQIKDLEDSFKLASFNNNLEKLKALKIIYEMNKEYYIDVYKQISFFIDLDNN